MCRFVFGTVEANSLTQNPAYSPLSAHLPSPEGIFGDRLRLVKPDGTTVPEYLLHISDGDVWFRYSDEPFE